MGQEEDQKTSHTHEDKKVRDKMRKVSYKLPVLELTLVQALSLPGAGNITPPLECWSPNISPPGRSSASACDGVDDSQSHEARDAIPSWVAGWPPSICCTADA